MIESFVLRLRPEALAAGRFVGRVEHVASGRQHTVTDLADIERFCLAVTKPAVVTPDPRNLAVPEGIGPT